MPGIHEEGDLILSSNCGIGSAYRIAHVSPIYREENYKIFKNNFHMIFSATIIAAMLILGMVLNVSCSPDSNIVLTKTVTPVQGACNEYLVKLGIAATAANKPVDVILVIDASFSMNSDNKLTNAKIAAKNFASILLAAPNANGNRVGLVAYSDSASRLQSLTTSLSTIKGAIDGINTGTYTNTQDAFAQSEGYFIASSGCDRVRAIVLLSDGVPTKGSCGTCAITPTSPNCCTNAAIAAGVHAYSASTYMPTVYTIGLLQGFSGAQLALAESVLIGSQNGGYYSAATSENLNAIYEAISGRIQYAAKTVTVIDTVPNTFNIKDLSLSATKGIITSSGNTVITWTNTILNTETVYMQYILKPTSGTCGDKTIETQPATMTYTTSDCVSNTLLFPVAPHVTISCLTTSITPKPGSVCQGSTLQLNGNPSGGSGSYTTHSWSGPGASYLSATDIVNPIFNSLAPAGSYTLTYTLTDSNGCTATDTTTIDVLGAPKVTALTPDQVLCINQQVLLTGTATNAGSLSWSKVGPGTLSTVDGATTTFTPEAVAGVEYTTTVVTFTANGVAPCSGSSDSRSLTITVYQMPHATILVGVPSQA